jgi:hypothetical protein
LGSNLTAFSSEDIGDGGNVINAELLNNNFGVLETRIDVNETRINDNSTRIDTISLTPGEDGEDGADGADGAPGIQGNQGDVGEDGADSIMYNGAAEGDMQYWNGNAWIMITAPAVDADSLSFCDGLPTWTQGGCPVYYKIGDKGPGGGWVFHITDGGLHGLEAAPVDQHDGAGAEWGCFDEAVSGAFSWDVGSGKVNTDLIKIHSCGIDPDIGKKPHAAAILADGYSFNGYSDWFLPNFGELQIMMNEFYDDNIGNMERDEWYWSSTQFDGSDGHSERYALAGKMDGGYVGEMEMLEKRKYMKYRVRAVREF